MRDVIIFVVLAGFIFSSAFFEQMTVLLSGQYRTNACAEVVGGVSSAVFAPISTNGITKHTASKIIFFIRTPPA